MSMGPLKVTFKRPSMEAESEFGSLSELAGALQDQGAVLIKLFGSDMETLVQGLGDTTAITTGTVGTGEATETKTETEAQRKRREKAEAKAKSDAARTEVQPPTAPPPAPIPPTSPIDTTPNANGIPAYLDATKTAAPPPPPPAPPAPSAPPVPPSGVLAGKIIPHMESIAAGQPDGGQAWADWLAQSEIVVKGATFAEAMKCIRMMSDEKLKPIADALKIAA